VDTSEKQRRRWTPEAKHQIVEESLEGSASVAELAQKYAVNANQIFQWRKKYREGRLEKSESINLLPVTVSQEAIVKAAEGSRTPCLPPTGTLKIELPKGNLRIAGRVDLMVLRTALECLLG
jgi:transposase